MRYKIIAPVQGDLFTNEKNISIEQDGYLFELYSNAKGKVIAVAISTKIPEHIKQKFKSTIETGNTNYSINIGGDKEFEELLISKLKSIEVDFAFSTQGSFRGVLWDNIEFEFSPENPEEKSLIEISSYSINQKYPPMPIIINSPDFEVLINSIDEKSNLLIPKSFWQQGIEYFRRHEYIQAFYSFFFILEDLFAEGKTGEGEVVKRFSRSVEFHKAGEHIFKVLISKKRHQDNIKRFFVEEGLEFEKENLPEFLFRMRGRTHHYSSKNPKTQPTPYSQKEFESISFITMGITSFILANKIQMESKKTNSNFPTT